MSCHFVKKTFMKPNVTKRVSSELYNVSATSLMTTCVIFFFITWLFSAHISANGHTFHGFLACRVTERSTRNGCSRNGLRVTKDYWLQHWYLWKTHLNTHSIYI